MSGRFVGLKNYKTVITNSAFQTAVKNTFKFVGFCIPILITVSLILAIFLNKNKKYTEFFKTTFLIPMAIPVASIVLLWKIFFNEFGILNELLNTDIDWINTSKAFYVLVFSYVWKNAGYNIVLWLAGLSNISPSLYEAAKVDGANGIQQFFAITIPSLMPTLFIITVLSLLNSFKVFREAYLISGSYPDDSIYMIQHLFNNWFVSLDIQKICSAAVLAAIFIFILILVLQRFWGNE